ncbi:hypothetical protein J7U46_03275 [Pelomonas sp. V22]|uniref:hypothetical protein n=1 Tax=Pelomonas sp. V22 TaxID=2822139 RepID=UPI0024A9F100|nr:hypothetical protein [Pelomonas sp. V22]MDI4632062.1 hypothetical protein [Pelomonas sp. V22]
MRAAFSILGLVVAFAIVMFMMKNQAKQLVPQVAKPVAGASAASSSVGQLPAPAAVGAQVQSAIDQAAAKASDAQP